MTSKSPSPSEAAGVPDDQQTCMLYLLGELDAERTLAFEQRLQSSPELGAELLRQADVISTLSQSTLSSPAAIVPPVRHRRLQWAAVLVAIAACIAFAMFSVRPTAPESSLVSSTSPTVSEDTLIAQAWASSRLADLDDDFGFAEPEFDGDLVSATEDVDIDSTLAWMYVAVSSAPEAIVAEMPNDG